MSATAQKFRVGAAVGSGMAARAAESAGADFILALGAGKMRSMGVPSPTALLPIYDAVEFTLDFASSELLPRVNLPVFVGLPLFDPRLRSSDLLPRLKALGISGLTNFPAVFHFGERAQRLDAHGLGFDREVAFLTTAASAGFDTIGYVRNRDEASNMVRAGLSSLCINFGLNPPRQDPSTDDENVNRIALAAKDIVDKVRKPARSLTIFLGGGPVSGGADLDKLCRKAGIDGFIGGSAMDRAPLEKSLLNTVASFREIEVLQDKVEHLERRLHRYSKRYGIVCHSDAMNRMLDRVETSVEPGLHLLIKGEENTGRRAVARMAVRQLRGHSKKESWELAFNASDNSVDPLFGRARNANTRRLVGVLELVSEKASLILAGIEHLTLEDQKRLANFLASGTYCATGENKLRHGKTRMVFVLTEDAPIDRSLAGILAKVTQEEPIVVPPLRDRIEDIPLLVKGFVSEFVNEAPELAASITRTLIRHNWPGNLAELKEAIRWMIIDRKMKVSEADMIAHLGGGTPTIGTATISHRDRIVQALLLNNLNRTKTADQLGITRKTLYNQIKRYNILS